MVSVTTGAAFCFCDLGARRMKEMFIMCVERDLKQREMEE